MLKGLGTCTVQKNMEEKKEKMGAWYKAAEHLYIEKKKHIYIFSIQRLLVMP